MGIFKKSKTMQEIEFMKKQVPGLTKQVNDCISLMDSTVKPDVFFSRYDFLLETLARLSEIAKYVKITGGKPAELLKKMSAPRTREEAVDTFIRRSHAKMMEDAASMKTEKGRASKIEQYHTAMSSYAGRMSAANRTALESLKARE